MTEQQLELIVFVAAIVCGVLIEVVIANVLDARRPRARRRLRFRPSRYLLLLVAPAGVVLWAAATVGAGTVWKMFIVFAFLGAFLEWLIGFSYAQVLAERLWTYHRLSIGGHTSLLAVPFWGLMGVLFLMISRAVLGLP